MKQKNIKKTFKKNYFMLPRVLSVLYAKQLGSDLQLAPSYPGILNSAHCKKIKLTSEMLLKKC